MCCRCVLQVLQVCVAGGAGSVTVVCVYLSNVCVAGVAGVCFRCVLEVLQVSVAGVFSVKRVASLWCSSVGASVCVCLCTKVRCSVLQCVAVCCSDLRHIHERHIQICGYMESCYHILTHMHESCHVTRMNQACATYE